MSENCDLCGEMVEQDFLVTKVVHDEIFLVCENCLDHYE